MDSSLTSMDPGSLPFDRNRVLDFWFKEIVGA